MRNYETMYILKPELEEEAIVTAVTRFEDVVKNGGGEIVKTDRWGKRRLAYEVNGITEGHYVLMTFKAPSSAAQELDRILRIQDTVVRQLVIKKDE
ncbi:MAG TPA: 30S ribosomal protein S6 [Firmicutes bacterium]|nr:30S ribosomal protein S6 [Bacillota bacterium]